MTDLHEHRAMIAEIDGLPKPTLPDGWTYTAFEFNAPNDEWNGVLYRDANGVPRQLSWYFWAVSDDNFSTHIREILGPDYFLGAVHGGNGRMDATVVDRVEHERLVAEGAAKRAESRARHIRRARERRESLNIGGMTPEEFVAANPGVHQWDKTRGISICVFCGCVAKDTTEAKKCTGIWAEWFNPELTP